MTSGKIDSHMRQILQNALKEDIGAGDITTESIVSHGSLARGSFIAKSDGVVAGWDFVEELFSLLDEHVTITRNFPDGTAVETGSVIGAIAGPAQAILKGERTALNFLQRMSGIATTTRRFVDAVKGTKAIILDTRKTVPGLRIFDKMAVRIGGGQNHRVGLFDMVLIKDNHIAEAGSITEAVNRVKEKISDEIKVEVEVRNLPELQEVLNLRVDRILLDNMTPGQMREAVGIVDGRVPLEASGNITLQNVAEVAATGVDFISVGALTHSVTAMDISLMIDRK